MSEIKRDTAAVIPVPDLSVPDDLKVEWLNTDIMRIPGLLHWGKYLVDVAETLPRWFPKRQDAAYPGPSEIRVEDSFAAVLGPAEQGLVSIVAYALKEYFDANPFARVSEDSGYHLLRYKEGEAYDVHCDMLGGMSTLKLMTMMMYPNDDYEGGEVYFPRQGIEFKPTAGDVYVYPSGFAYPHGTRPVKSGTRYCVVTWLK